MDQREYDRLEGEIEKAEAELASAHNSLEDPSLITDAAKLLEATTRAEAAQALVDRLYSRWEELEAKLRQ